MTPAAASRTAWSLCAVTLAAAAVQVALRIPQLSELAEAYDPFLTFPIITVATLAAAVVGAVIVGRHPANPVGWLFCVTNCIAELGLAAESYAEFSGLRASALPAAGYAASFQALTGAPFALAGLSLLLLLFPDGTLLSRRWRPAAWLTVGSLLLFELGVLAYVGDPRDTRPTSQLDPDGADAVVLGLAQLGIVAGVLSGAAALVVRRRRARGDERQQLRLVTLAVSVFGASVVALALYEVLLAPQGVPRVGPETAFYLAYGGLPVAAGLAILKYRLYEVDLIVNRAVVFTGLATASTAVYVALVVVLGSLLGDQLRAGTTVDLLVTAAVAVAVQPLRRQVVRLADRVAYGSRAAPYDVLAAFTERIASTLSVDDVLPRMAAAAAQGVGARSARVQVRLTDGSERSVVWPPQAEDHAADVAVPVRHLGEELGRIELCVLPGGALHPGSQHLLADLASQAGVALRNVRLTVELRARVQELEQSTAALAASRARLVTASTGERQRLERQIADRVQPHLAALGAGLPGVTQLLAVPEQAGRALEPLVEEATAALEALREVAHGVYPPLLVDHGLLPAVESVARGARVPVRVVVDDPAGVLTGERRLRPPAATEAAAYFCLLDVLSAAEPEAGVEVHLRAEPDRVVVVVAGAGPAPDALAAAQDRAGARGGVVRVEPGPRPTVVIALPTSAGGDVRDRLAV